MTISTTINTYLRRDHVCRQLRLGRSQSYRIVAPAYGSRIASSEVVLILNNARRNVANPLTAIPSDIVTADELIESLAGSDITVGDVLRWSRRSRNGMPCFRLNKQTTRFSKSMVNAWLERTSRIRKSTGDK